MFLSSTARNNSEISSNVEGRLLITFAKCLDPDQAQQNISDGIAERIFFLKIDF